MPGGAAPDEVVLERELALEVDRCPVLPGADPRRRPVPGARCPVPPLHPHHPFKIVSRADLPKIQCAR